jgi:hypothetical protein
MPNSNPPISSIDNAGNAQLASTDRSTKRNYDYFTELDEKLAQLRGQSDCAMSGGATNTSTPGATGT